MHNESMMVAGGLAVIGAILAAQKSQACKKFGMFFAALAALMIVAGVSG